MSKAAWLAGLSAAAVVALPLPFGQVYAASQDSVPWCGGSRETQADRPDTSAALKLHVIYAIPSVSPDLFATRASQIATDVSAIDQWWRGQDPTRAPRFDTFNFPDCSSTAVGPQLDISVVPLKELTADRSQALYGNIVYLLQPLFHDPNKRYIVLVEGVKEDGACGRADIQPGDGGGNAESFSVLYLAGACGADLGKAGFAADAIAHELIHNLGAVVKGASHACSLDPGHTCDNPKDILTACGCAAPPAIPTLATALLDPGRDDYYGHSGKWWDVRDSPYLEWVGVNPRPLLISGLQASSSGCAGVTLSWHKGRGGQDLRYRLTKNGALYGEGPANGLSAAQVASQNHYCDVQADPGQSLSYTVQSMSPDGRLSNVLSIAIRVSAGGGTVTSLRSGWRGLAVDAAGRVLTALKRIATSQQGVRVYLRGAPKGAVGYAIAVAGSRKAVSYRQIRVSQTQFSNTSAWNSPAGLVGLAFTAKGKSGSSFATVPFDPHRLTVISVNVHCGRLIVRNPFLDCSASSVRVARH